MSAVSERLQQTVAPDLARFDKRKTVRRAYEQEQAQRAQAAARKAPSRAAKISVSPFSVAAFLMAFALLFYIVFSYMNLSVINSTNEAMRKELTKLRNENTQLLKEYENKIMLSDVAARAEALGMVKPERAQITYLDLSGQDEAIVVERESAVSRIMAGVQEGCTALLEYLG